VFYLTFMFARYVWYFLVCMWKLFLSNQLDVMWQIIVTSKLDVIFIVHMMQVRIHFYYASSVCWKSSSCCAVWQPDSNHRCGWAAPCQKCITGVVLGWACKIALAISPNPPLNFIRDQKVWNLASLFNPSHLWCTLILKRSNISEM